MVAQGMVTLRPTTTRLQDRAAGYSLDAHGDMGEKASAR